MREVRYKADITAGALKLPESRIIAGLLLRKVDAEGWKDAIVTKNVLQTRNPATAKRLTTLIRGRLETMGPDLWKLVRDGKGTVATHAVFAAAVKYSPLLGDFLDLVVGEQYRMFGMALTNRMFADYLEGCRERDPEMPLWNESTRGRLRSSVFQMLAQAGYVDSTRGLIQTAKFESSSGNLDDRKKWASLVLKERQYNKKTPYRLVLRDVETGIEQQSVEVIIDRAFTDDF